MHYPSVCMAIKILNSQGSQNVCTLYIYPKSIEELDCIGYGMRSRKAKPVGCTEEGKIPETPHKTCYVTPSKTKELYLIKKGKKYDFMTNDRLTFKRVGKKLLPFRT